MLDIVFLSLLLILFLSIYVLFFNKFSMTKKVLGSLLLVSFFSVMFHAIVGYIADIGRHDNITVLAQSAQENNFFQYHFGEYALLYLVALFIFTFTLSFLLARAIIKPVKILVQGANQFSSGNFDHKVEIKSRDELAELGNAFNVLGEKLSSLELRDKSREKELEKEVEIKTKEIREMLNRAVKDKEELQKQKLATLNVLEDVSDTQKKIEESNKALEKKSRQLSALKKLGDDLTGVLDIEEAISTINNYLKGLLSFSSVTYLIINPLKEGGVIYTAFLHEHINEKYLQEIKTDLIKFLDNENSDNLSTVKNLINNIEPHFEGKSLNNKSVRTIKSKILFPLRVGNYTLGVIHLASSSTNLGNQRRELTDAMIATFALSVARLHTLISSQQSKTESLVESLDDGVVMFDENREIILANPAMQKILDRDVFSLGGLDRFLIGQKISKLAEKALKGINSHVEDIEYKNKYFELFIGAVKGAGDKIVGGKIILHDITHIKEVDRMKTEFVSIASHQLRTPLTAVKLFTEMLLHEEVGKLTADQKDYLKNIFQSSERMVRLVNDLLSLSRLESGQLRIDPEKVNLEKFMSNTIEEVIPLAESRKIKIIFKENKNNSSEVSIDQTLTRQVLNNLLTNAIRYSEPGKGIVNIELEKKPKEYVLKIKDNGMGIPDEKQKRIFAKFFRADNAIKKETEGSGLGLYVCKMIVENTGGKIWFESKKNKGSTFYFTVPAKGMKKREGEKTLPKVGGEVSFS